jgi:hypothetical protein
MRLRRTILAAAVAATGVALAPAAAQAATVTVTGDDGNPVGIAPGAPPTIRNMQASVGVARSVPGSNYMKRGVTGPDGVQLAFGADTCWILSPMNVGIDYRGNGTYTVGVQEYSDGNCTVAVGPPTTVQYNVAADVALTPPPGVVLTRPKNDPNPITHELGFTGNPGAFGYDILYARDGVIGPDGGISGPSAPAFVNDTTGKVELRLSEPGSYTVVARANGAAFNSPWSGAVTVRAKAPFDLSSAAFTDTRGPSYKIQAQIGEDAARGRVKIAIAKGRRGGRFHSLGNAKIRSNGSFTKRFRHRGLGRYRIRFSYEGSSLVQKGTVTRGARFRRSIVF